MKVMLVDDSRTMRNIEKSILTQLGYTDVIEAADGAEAMTQAEQHNPDLILLDWNMPNVDGLTFMQRFREKNKTTPIIMVTTESEKRRVVEAIKAGVCKEDCPFSTFKHENKEERLNTLIEKMCWSPEYL